MRFVALVSGGKDSCHALLRCVADGHQCVALANLHPPDRGPDELDSFMFQARARCAVPCGADGASPHASAALARQTVGHEAVAALATALQLPLVRREVRGSSKHTSMVYEATPGDEVEDLRDLLAECQRAFPDLEAVAAALSDRTYQVRRRRSVRRADRPPRRA